MVSALVVGTNTYITRAQAITYHGDSLRGASWAGYSEEQMDQALLTATRILERQCWQGEPLVPGQALHFPATGLTNKQGDAVSSATVPQEVKDAQAELALDLILDSALEMSGGQGSNIQSLGAGSARISYFRPTGGVNGAGSARFSVPVMELIGQFMCGAGASSTPFVSGTDVESGLEDFHVSEGFP